MDILVPNSFPWERVRPKNECFCNCFIHFSLDFFPFYLVRCPTSYERAQNTRHKAASLADSLAAHTTLNIWSCGRAVKVSFSWAESSEFEPSLGHQCWGDLSMLKTHINLWKLTLRGHLNTDVQAGLELGTLCSWERYFNRSSTATLIVNRK